MTISIKWLRSVITLLVCLLAATSTIAQEGNDNDVPKLFYYGEEVTYEELIDVIPGDQHCIENVDLVTLNSRNSFSCFDSFSEVEAIKSTISDVILRQRDMSSDTNRTICTNHSWALYYYSGYNSLITILANYQGISNANAIWSLLKTCLPLPITLYGEPSYGGGSFTYTSSAFTTYWGGRSAIVQ